MLLSGRVLCILTNIKDVLHKGVRGQLSIVLDHFAIGEDVDAVHLVEVWEEKGRRRRHVDEPPSPPEGGVVHRDNV